jgi:hypothetical protein
MLPPEHRNPRMEALSARLSAIPAQELFSFPVLQAADHQLFGAYIQLYNYMDLNLRRSVEAFAAVGMLPAAAARKYPKLHSSEIAPTVREVVQAMDPATEDLIDTLQKLGEIERRREFRNLMGHWAARRFPGEDTVFFLTKDERDAKQVGGEYLALGKVKTAIADLADLRGLAQHMIGYEIWLANKTSEWFKRYVS